MGKKKNLRESGANLYYYSSWRLGVQYIVVATAM